VPSRRRMKRDPNVHKFTTKDRWPCDAFRYELGRFGVTWTSRVRPSW
jgi:hypothetical protein